MSTSPSPQQALLRAREAFQRKPAAALHEDMHAVASWQGGLGMQLQHPEGMRFRTDMPELLGGAGQAPTPGWFFRAGVASCTATRIAMEAEMRGIALTRLEVEAHSESDSRGMLGDASVPAGPLRFWLQVTLQARDATEAQLRELVAVADTHSPMASCLRQPPALHLELRLPAAD